MKSKSRRHLGTAWHPGGRKIRGKCFVGKVPAPAVLITCPREVSKVKPLPSFLSEGHNHLRCCWRKRLRMGRGVLQHLDGWVVVITILLQCGPWEELLRGITIANFSLSQPTEHLYQHTFPFLWLNIPLENDPWGPENFIILSLPPLPSHLSPPQASWSQFRCQSTCPAQDHLLADLESSCPLWKLRSNSPLFWSAALNSEVRAWEC